MHRTLCIQQPNFEESSPDMQQLLGAFHPPKGHEGGLVPERPRTVDATVTSPGVTKYPSMDKFDPASEIQEHLQSWSIFLK